jgi:hypothetical protein
VAVPYLGPAATGRCMTVGPQRPPTTRLRTGAVLVAIVGGIAAAGILLAAEPGALRLPGR